VHLKYYPAGVMGDDKAVLRKMRIGQLQGAALTAGAFENIYPDSQIYSLPLIFQSFEQVDRVRQQIDPMLIAGFKEKGFVTFGFAEGGFAYPMTKTEPIREPSHLKQHKVWAPTDDEMSVLAFSTIDITPVPLALGDVLAGLQTGLVDTIASPPVPALVMQWHTQVKTLTDIPISYVFGLLVIDRKIFRKISKSDRAIVSQVMSDVFETLDKLNRQDGLNALAALQQQGIEILSLTEAEKQEWAMLGEQAQQKLEEQKLFSPDVYDHFQKALAQ
jgi:TRAP-type C4-dicarboxylate transport system substrate-binding protein